MIVVTDRGYSTVRSGTGSGNWRRWASVGHAKGSGDLRRFIASGKKIIISTVQKFPFILDEIGNEQRGRSFAIIIDEAHSSQGGRTSAAMTQALSEAGEVGEEETYEDRINRVMESRKLLPDASYFAFTATPKNKTLEIVGAPDPQPDGSVRHYAFHSYSMKQAIQEGFILDVLAHYTPVASYYRLAKTVEDDPEFDARRAQKKLRRYVEGSDHAISLKAEIMVDHFHDQVLAQNKIGGAARAMVVTNGIERAVQYYHAIRDYLQERQEPPRSSMSWHSRDTWLLEIPLIPIACTRWSTFRVLIPFTYASWATAHQRLLGALAGNPGTTGSSCPSAASGSSGPASRSASACCDLDGRCVG